MNETTSIDRASGRFLELRDDLIDRAAEAERLASLIASAPTHVVVLYGEPDSGKTELVTRWLIPALRERREWEAREVLFGKCAPEFPKQVGEGQAEMWIEAALSSPRIVVVDSFDELLGLPRAEQREQLDALFALLERSDPHATVVLVVDSRQLSGVYALAAYDQQATAAVFEIEALPADEALLRISLSNAADAVEYEPALLRRVHAECQELGARRKFETFSLARLIHSRVAAACAERGTRTATAQLYTEVGEARGILRDFLERQLGLINAAQPGDEDIARGILECMLDASEQGVPLDFVSAGARIGATPADMTRLQAAMQKHGILEHMPFGGWRARPPQLLNITEEDLAAHARQIEAAHRSVIEGARVWALNGTVLSAQRFAEIHVERRYLNLDADQTRLLLQSSLLYGPDRCAEYWFYRVVDGADRRNTLFRALVHESPDVRRRAVFLLGRESPGDPDVCEATLEAATSDTEPTVREEAVRSLGRHKSPKVKAKLLAECIDGSNRNRAAAIEALQIFDDPEHDDDVAASLQGLVTDRGTPVPLRQTAIHVLSTLGTENAADRLLSIALDDPDDPDRAAAAKAVATIQAPGARRRVLESLASGRRPERAVVGLIVALVFGIPGAVLTMIWVSTFQEGAIRPIVIGTVITFAAAVAAGWVFDALANQRLRRASVRGIGGIALFFIAAWTITLFVHGLAHLTTRRRANAARIFLFELLGVVCILLVPPTLASIPGVDLLRNVYYVVGVVLYVGTYLYDVVDVFMDSVFFVRSSNQTRRRECVYRELFASDGYARDLFEMLGRTGASGDVRPAMDPRRLFKRYGATVPRPLLVEQLRSENPVVAGEAVRLLARGKKPETMATLERAWPTATDAQRDRIITVLTRHPTDESLAAVTRIRHDRATTQAAAREGGGGWKLAVPPSLHRVRSLTPRGVGIALVVLPALLVVLYNGVRTVRNPVWPILTKLRQNESLVSTSQKVTNIDVLAKAYPAASAATFWSLYRDLKPGDSLSDAMHRDALYASLTQALTLPEVRGALPARDRAAAAQALTVAVRYYARRVSDSTTFSSAHPSLKAAAHDQDSSVSGPATAALAQAAVADGLSAEQRQLAVETIGALPYARSLPLLAGLIKSRSDSRRDAAPSYLVQELSHAISATVSSVADSTGTVQYGVLQLLKGLNYKNAQINQQILAFEASPQLQCSIRKKAGCTKEDVLLQFVQDNPTSEIGYLQLTTYYTQNKSAATAVHVLDSLQQKYSGVIWPARGIATTDHEILALDDTTYFRRSYDRMEQLRRQPSYAALRAASTDDYERIESDFQEIALSARQYAEADSLGTQLLRSTANPTWRLNAALFSYMAMVLAGNPTAASNRLDQLARVVASLPASFSNEWTYPGTTAFIKASSLSNEREQAMLDLLKPGRWTAKTTTAFQEAIARNRALLNRTASDR